MAEQFTFFFSLDNLPLSFLCFKPVPCSNPIPGGMFPKRTIIIRGNVPYGAYRCVCTCTSWNLYNKRVQRQTFYNKPSLHCRFTINFVVSRTRDIAFHMNPRVQDETVVRNSMIEGDWGWEETDLDFNPFEGGEYFDVSGSCVQGSIWFLCSCCIQYCDSRRCLDFTLDSTVSNSVSQMSIRCGSEKFKVFVNGLHFCEYSHRFKSVTEIDKLEIAGDVYISYIHFWDHARIEELYILYAIQLFSVVL